MGDTVNIHEAKTHLSRLLERVRRGRTVIIARAGTPIARLVPLGEGPAARRVREPLTLPARAPSDRGARLRRFLDQEVWPRVPEGERGRVLTREEEDAILGFGQPGA